MLKQTIEYTDFDDNTATETLHFNLTKSELTEHLYLKDQLEELQELVVGEKRTLGTPEIMKILELVKTFMRLSYGERSEDGKRFSKSPEKWQAFSETAAYDAFLFSLFEKPEKAVEFMSGILPLDLREKAKAAAEKEMAAYSAKQETVQVDNVALEAKPETTPAAPQVVQVDNVTVEPATDVRYQEWLRAQQNA